MATFSQKDIQSLFIGAAATKTTGGIDTLNTGEIGIFSPAGTRLTEATAATADSFRIVKATADGILDSGIIKKADIKTANVKAYVASSNKVDSIGFDGTSGSIDVVNDNTYHVRVNMVEGRTSNHGGMYLKHGFYKSDATATQFEIASNLLEALTNEFSKEPGRKVQTQMLINNAGAALGGGPATLAYTKGSKILLASSASHGVVAGDALRIGTAVTDPCYLVTAVNGAEITVNSFITEATAAAAAGEVIVAATAATADCGIVLTGLDATHVVGKLHNDLQPTDFQVTLEGFGVTPQVSTAANPGTGTEKQVKELEFFAQGNEGDIYRMGEPNVFAQRAEASGNYDLLHIVVQENYTGSIVSGPIHKQYTLALPETAPNYAVTGTADDITDVLEVLAFGSATGALAVS